MHPPVIASTISRSNRNLLILAAVCLIGLGAYGLLSYRYFSNFFAGPYAIPSEELLGASDADEIFRYYVSLEGDEVADTGFSRERRRNGVVVSTQNYLGLLIEDRLLLVETPRLAISTSFSGSLVDISSEIHDEVIAEMEAEYPELEGVFLPMMLRDDNFKLSGYLGLAAAAATLLLSAYLAFTVTRRSSDPSKHPIMRALARFGDPRLVISDLEAQLAAPHHSVGMVHFTPGWVAQLAHARVDATRYEDIVWVYKQVTQRRVNGIPTGKTYTAHVCDRHGTTFAIQAKEEQVNQTLNEVLGRAPWALGGHSSEVEQAWKRNRSALVGAVDQRRQQLAAGAS